jgi:protein involved in polysaccharide export with SLBB domain
MRNYFQIFISLLAAATALGQDTTNMEGSDALARLSGSYVLDDQHVLTPGDKVSVRVLEDKIFEDKETAKSLTVTDSRELDAPYIGRVSVAGKTCKEVAGQLKTLLEKDYYYRATVIVGLDSVNKLRGKAYVQGQVRNQGPIDLLFDQKVTAGKAILMAGGFSDFANKKKIKVIRTASGPEGKAQTFEIDMEAVLEHGETDKDILLEPNDYIIVPARSVNF